MSPEIGKYLVRSFSVKCASNMLCCLEPNQSSLATLNALIQTSAGLDSCFVFG